MERKYKREDAIELNEENVVSLYRDCLATPDTPEGNSHRSNFIYSDKMPDIQLDYEKIKQNRGKVSFLYGQLYYTHLIHRENDELTSLSMSQGVVNYKSEAWTQNQSILFALYYLGVASSVIETFDPRGKTYPYNYDSLVPTFSPNDPAFTEWAKVHIED